MGGNRTRLTGLLFKKTRVLLIGRTFFQTFTNVETILIFAGYVRRIKK